jgi:serine/threonine-protein kinase
MDVDGGNCRFFLVRDDDEPASGRLGYVAKLLEAGRAADANRRRNRFEHEVKLLKAFNHPCIPTLHAAGDQDGVSYAVLDRVDGINLATLLAHDRGEPIALSKEVAVYVMGQIADALRHIHNVEFLDDDEPKPLAALHRALSPQHVAVSKNGDVVLCGFGNATSAWLDPEDDDDKTGVLAYLAPERLAGDGRATEKTELFAMAVMLWEMLKGQRCLAGADADETRENINRFDIGQSSRRVSGLSPKLSEIVRKNLDRDPDRRYASAFQMLQRLAQAPEAQAAEASRAQLAKMVADATSSA